MAEEGKKEKKVTNLTTPFLVVLLLVVAFMAGSFYTSSKSTEKAGGEAVVPTTQAAQQPQEGTTLAAADWAAIQDSELAKGKPGAAITIVEFSEYQCPYCKRYVDETYGRLWEEYGDQLYYVFRDYPLPFHQHAQKTAEAARCAAEQGKFWEYHDLLFEKKAEWEGETDPSSVLVGFARELGLKTSDFSSCLSTGKYAQAVKDDLALGQSVGVGGTPSFFINGQMLVGAQPFENFKAIIDAELVK